MCIDKSNQLNDSVNPIEPSSSTSSVLAGMSRSIATNTSIVIISILKGTIKWWFRVPVKLFRPYVLNPWWIFTEMAKKHGQSLSPSFIRFIITNHGVLYYYIFFNIVLVGFCLEKYSSFIRC